MRDWKEALAPTPECIPLDRLGEELDAAERAHVDGCARCQSELALFREMQREESSPEEARAVEWIAGELRRRNDDQRTVGVLPADVRASRLRERGGGTPPPQPAERRPFGSWRMLYAAAAVILMALGAGWWMQLREPSIDVPLDGTAVYRSARLDVISPIGELSQPPNELRWSVVPDASRYQVRILEVDATVVWNAETTQPRAALPPAVIAQFAPGKSLLWEVKAFRGTEMLASSETQTVRVNPE